MLEVRLAVPHVGEARGGEARQQVGEGEVAQLERLARPAVEDQVGELLLAAVGCGVAQHVAAVCGDHLIPVQVGEELPRLAVGVVGDAEHEQPAGPQQLEESGERRLHRGRHVLEDLAANDQVVAPRVLAGGRYVQARLAVVERVRVAHAARERGGERRVVAHPGADQVGAVRERRDGPVGREQLAGDDGCEAAEPRRRAAHRAGGRVARPAAVLGDAVRRAQVAGEPVQARVGAGQAQVVEAAQRGGLHPR